MERARAVRPEFGLTAQNAPAVAEVCIRLDGLPLAIELAAARLKLLPPRAILARLGSRLELLSGGAQDRPARHQTLRAALASSHDLLSAEEQRLLRRLAVFVGGCTLEAAEAVCAFGAGEVDGDGLPPSASPVFDRLAALVDQSLLQETEHPDGEPRFVMLETIREYGLERLEASGEAPATRRRHAEYYLGLLEAAEPEFRRAEQMLWLERLQGELDNLRAALAWSHEEAKQGRAEGARRALHAGSALAWLWSIRGHFSEARRRLEWMLAASGDAPTPARARALNAAGYLASAQGEFGRASALHEAALLASRALADERSVADSLRGMGLAARHRGAVEQAAALLEESVALYRRLGDPGGVALALRPLSLTSETSPTGCTPSGSSRRCGASTARPRPCVRRVWPSSVSWGPRGAARSRAASWGSSPGAWATIGGAPPCSQKGCPRRGKSAIGSGSGSGSTTWPASRATSGTIGGPRGCWRRPRPSGQSSARPPGRRAAPTTIAPFARRGRPSATERSRRLSSRDGR